MNSMCSFAKKFLDNKVIKSYKFVAIKYPVDIFNGSKNILSFTSHHIVCELRVCSDTCISPKNKKMSKASLYITWHDQNVVSHHTTLAIRPKYTFYVHCTVCHALFAMATKQCGALVYLDVQSFLNEIWSRYVNSSKREYDCKFYTALCANTHSTHISFLMTY